MTAAVAASLEQQHVAIGERMMQRLCSDVELERWIGTRYRCDIYGVLPNGKAVYVETKAFDDSLTPLIDAVFQAASYADELKSPVFVGPLYGKASEFSAGRLDNAIGAVHLMAGRMNVGYLCENRWGTAYLLLRGQVVADQDRLHSNFDNVWRYTEQRGSQRIRT